MNITSIQTKLAGLGGILAAIAGVIKDLTDGIDTTNPNWTATATAICLGWGLLVARQNNVKSETIEAAGTKMVEPKPDYIAPTVYKK